ncbi:MULTISPECIES: DNA polymerase III subunit beta [Clostridium]|jgi:DNA polymerase III, beta subunit (EC 2.7.7.7)|uniref:Beta sliding clamp n=2 Tax=Clostridium beijerinckii TaxID=1520 RepID=A0A1S8RNJ9_CLOBE|nr:MULTISPECIES: DNA polymerase III subunit beta [Clostridium]ABR32192.1 DNA polymerase III, beta subunit [Clostridium beijerinckii NCIMB 8052]AIU00472.1 DNA polymerase III subunit beta [Clostridium beijerinckii ATCC 35702]MBE6090877.1 DNA polymerase III subunit beta [Clostridium beijerinckii]MBF7808132.1 DNA polymerase III subunit beta [Clostridium beijerinckii]NOW88731.1 DNA polymerase-3 subunit beta [Clostridium beijerinckii]
MIFTCEKQKILEGISIVQKAITGKSTMPILEGIYINANNSTITLIGSDMDVSIQTLVDATIMEEGSIVIDAKIFGEIIRKLPNSTIRIETMENQLIKITCEKSIFDVVYMNTNEFPELPEINENLKISVNQNILKNMIKGTSFAIAQDETRPILQGILFEVRNKNLNLVALDGYRLAIKSEFLDTDIDIEVVIPGKTLNEVSKILEDIDEIVDITFTNNHILFNLKRTKIISRLLEGKFINYKSLLPQEHKLFVNVNRQELQNAIERASLMAKDGNTNLIKLDLHQDNLVITSNSQLGKVRDEISIKLQGDEIEIAFNSKYLLDVLKNMEDNEVVMKMTSGISPCVIEEHNNENAKYLVLPVRLMR